jgi:hypothetical protein
VSQVAIERSTGARVLFTTVTASRLRINREKGRKGAGSES